MSSVPASQSLKYLQKDQIGKVIAKGLANLYTNKPQRPVKYLAEWLKSYSKNKKQLAKTISEQKGKRQFMSIFEQTQKVNELNQKENQKKDKQFQAKIKEFENMVAKHEYQQELLQQILPEFVQKHTAITGAYVGELNHPPKQITEKDTAQTAHLDTEAQKVINYIGSSVSHKNLMRGKMLKLSQGVTSKVFALAEQEPVAQVGEDGQQKPKVEKEKYVYIPNVVKNQSMHYFRIPKLGAYLAVPLICKSYLAQKIFDQVLAEKKKQIQQNQDFIKKKHDQLQQFNHTKQDLTKKITEMKDKHVDEAQIEPFSNQLAQLEKKIAQKQAQKYNPDPIESTSLKNNYVFCVDNLGKDRQLSQSDIKLITNLIEHFKHSWQLKQKELLFKDIATQIEYLKSLPNTPENIQGELEKSKEIDEEAMKEINNIEDQFLKNYKIQEEEFNRVKNYIKSNQIFVNAFLKLKEFRVVKYRDLIQNLLYFLGETKEKINVPKRAALNWKDSKIKYITKDTFNNILNYIVQGPKEKNFTFYQKTQFLLELLSKFNEQQIFTYNIGLGALLNFIKRALKHRISNVNLRKAQKQAQRKQKQAIRQQNEKIDARKDQQLKQHKDNLPPDEVEGFNEQKWTEQFYKVHQKQKEPDQIIDDKDNDMEAVASP